jgi:hypothetical protein
MGFVAQQAGYQIQDFATQVAGGQSAMLAFGQQAPQLFSVFGVGGAVFGAVIAVAAAIGGTLVNSIKAAKEEAETLPPAIKKFAEDMEKKFSGVDLANRADLARVEIGKLNTEYEKTQERVTALTAELKDLDTFGPSSKFVKSGEQYTKAWQDANYELKAAKAQLDEVKQRLEITANISNQGLGTQTLEDATDSSQKLKSATESLTQQLTLQKVALEQGELAAMLQAAAWQTGADSVAKLDPAIGALITNNYNLEQSQKAAAAAQSELTKEIEKQAEADQRAAERSIREQQRLDQRIANMRLETETLSSETLLQQAVLDGKFSYEESQLAAQTAAKIMAATTEYEQLQALAGEDYARKLEAEAAFKEQIAAINEQYAMGQDELDLRRIMMAEDTAQRIRDANVSAFSSGVSIMESFLGRSNGIVKAARIAMGAYQAFSIYASSQAAAAAALAPPPLGLGPIAGAGVASAISLSGKLNAAAVMAAAASSAFAGSGSGGYSVGGGGASAGAATLPTTPQSAPTVGAFEIVGLAGLQNQLDRLDNDEVLPVSFTKRLVASLESVQRLQGA